MLRTSNTATMPKYVGMPCRKSPRSNRPVKITAPKATKATRANALWKALDHGTEITNNTAPTPRKRSVPKESGANVCQAYPARKTIPSTGRNLSRCDLIRYPREHFRSVELWRWSCELGKGYIMDISQFLIRHCKFQSDLPDYLSNVRPLLLSGVLSHL